jgi:predicted PurR-regulated permease PerM
VLVALFLIWKVRTFVGWFVIALFLAAVLNPAVNWLQRRHRLIKRPIAIALTYLGLVVALLFVVGIFLPLLVDQINGFIKFVSTAAQAPKVRPSTSRASSSTTASVGSCRGSTPNSQT